MRETLIKVSEGKNLHEQNVLSPSPSSDVSPGDAVRSSGSDLLVLSAVIITFQILHLL